jgi:hypothetical protein
MSSQNLMTAYTVGTNPAFVQGVEPSGLYVQGSDPSLGIGEFIYGQMSNATGCVAGNVCEFTQTLYSSGVSISLINSFQQWQGTANSGKALGVALATLAQNQFGWFQVVGNALTASNGAGTVGSPVYWEANGVISIVVVASKQMLTAVGVLAPSASFGQGVFVTGVGTSTPALTASQVVLNINAPHAQGAIT